MNFRDSDDCPVCGASHTRCASGTEGSIRIIGADLFPSLGYEDVYVVQEDFYVNRQVSGSELLEGQTFSRVRVAKKGDILKISEAKRLGLIS